MTERFKTLKSNKRNISVQLIRIVAMFMIILDHLLSLMNFPLKSIIVQVTNSGVLIFLFLSGYLFGKKKIDNLAKWYIRRIIRICIPMWIFMIVDFIIEYVMWGYFEVKNIFVYLFNLQGIFGGNIAGASLWFLTLIMLCYLLTPFLQWIKNNNPNKSVGILVLTLAVILQIILAYVTDLGMVGGHTLSWCVLAVGMYTAGYFIGDTILPDYIRWSRIGLMTVLMIVSSTIALIFNLKFDGQVIYDRIVIYYGMIVIDLWICTVLYKIGKSIKVKWIIKIIDFLDTISYEFYVVHGLIISAIALPVLMQYGVIVYIVGTVFFSLIAASLLHWVCNRVYEIKKLK